MLDQLKKGYKKIVYSWKSSEFKSAEQCEGKYHKPSPSAQFSVRAIPSRIYIQLDARPIEESCGKVVFLKKDRVLKEGRVLKKDRVLKEGRILKEDRILKEYIREKALNPNRLSNAKKRK